MQTFTLSSTGVYRLNVAPDNVGPDGVRFQFTIDGTTSGVLAKNTAPPGSAVSLTNVAYLNASLVVQAAGTAVTASGLAYITAADAALDLYLTLTHTSGTVVVNVDKANIGGGSAPGGAVPAADVTAGTFGANTGDTGDYTFPDDVTVTDVLTADELVADTSITGTLATASQPNVTTLGPLTAVTENAAAGAATSAVTDVKAVAAIADNVATTVATITVPNSAQAAVLTLTLVGSLGAGGDIGAYEASAVNSYNIVVSRTAGVNAVAEISGAYGADASAVAGAATVTAAVTLGAVVGAVGDPNTVPVQVTIVKSGGASDNHTALLRWTLLNAVASGVTVA